jgi:hypothetical protein
MLNAGQASSSFFEHLQCWELGGERCLIQTIPIFVKLAITLVISTEQELGISYSSHHPDMASTMWECS